MENFNLVECIGTIKEETIGKKVYQNTQQTKEYIKTRIYPLLNGQHIHRSDGKYAIIEKHTLNDIFLDRLPKDVKTWYHSERNDLKNIDSWVDETTKADTINLFPGFIHEKTTSVDTTPIQPYLDFILQTICNDNMDQYAHVINWLASTIQGKKNHCALYLKGAEGIGKSTFVDFLVDYVFGSEISLKSNSEPLRSQYNKCLMNKLLVVFEEMPVFGTNEWEGISSKLKEMITGDSIQLNDKYEKAVNFRNFNNYVINTNVSAIKHDDGRRYFILDLSERHKEDHAYFSYLRDACFNKECGSIMYNWLRSIDLSNYYSQKFPDTQAKIEARILRLDSVYKFIKDAYVLNKKPLKVQRKDFYDEYKSYCVSSGISPSNKIEFGKRLATINLIPKKTNGFYEYNYSRSELNQIATTNKWLHSSDDYSDNEQQVSPLDEGLSCNSSEESITDEPIISINAELQEENTKLRAEIEELKLQIQQLKAVQKADLPIKKQSQKIATTEKKKAVSEYDDFL